MNKRDRFLFFPRLRVLFVVGIPLIGLWELGALYLSSNETALAGKKLPYPHRVAQAMVDNWPDLWSGIQTTATGALIGLAIGTAIGVTIALVAGSSRIAESALYPYVVAGQMLPSIAVAPILLVILKDIDITRIVVASYITFFPISLNTLKGLRSTPKDCSELMRSFSSSSMHTLLKLRIPAALPFFFTGFKIAAPLSIVAEIVVEFSGATDGLGYLILVTQYYGPQFASFFWAALVITMAIGILYFRLATRLERLLTPWQPEFRKAV